MAIKFKEINTGQVVEFEDEHWIKWAEGEARWERTDEPATDFTKETEPETEPATEEKPKPTRTRKATTAKKETPAE